MDDDGLADNTLDKMILDYDKEETESKKTFTDSESEDDGTLNRV
jgi:hypothetical protein